MDSKYREVQFNRFGETGNRNGVLYEIRNDNPYKTVKETSRLQPPPPAVPKPKK